MKKQKSRRSGAKFILLFLAVCLISTAGLFFSDCTVSDTFTEQPQPDTAAQNTQPVTTGFTDFAGRELLTGGVIDIVYYNQSEEPWKDMKFATDPLSSHGCGPTVMAMAVSSLTSQTIDPSEMAQWASDQGYGAPGEGAYHTIVEGTASAFGLEAKVLKIDTADELRLELASGKIFVALMSKGHFTNSGHFILLRGLTLDGDVLVADPNSRERSLAAWDPQLVLDEAKSDFWELSPAPQN